MNKWVDEEDGEMDELVNEWDGRRDGGIDELE